MKNSCGIPGASVLVSAIVWSLVINQTESGSSQAGHHETQWSMVYSHDQDGSAIEGNKEELLEHVRAGKPVRIYFGSGRVEHVADGSFLTIFDGELFAQVEAIQSQQPTTEPTAVTYREPGVYWRTIIGTNGETRPLMDGNEPRSRKIAGRWFVQM